MTTSNTTAAAAGHLRPFHIAKGKKDFRPLDGFMPVVLTDGYHEVWEVIFEPSCRYRLPGVEQLDWNKGGGVSLTLFGRECSGRWVWRYAPATDVIELAAYYYLDGTRIIPRAPDGTEVQHYVPLGQLTRIEMYRDMSDGDLVIHFQNDAITRQRYTPAQWPSIGREMGLHFGGANAQGQPHRAPNAMGILMNRIKIK